MNEFLDTTAHDEKLKKSKRLLDREVSDLKKIISIPEGRRFIWRILSDAGIYQTSFTGNSTTFYLEGRRSLGLEVLKDLMKAERTAFAQIQLEHFSEANSLNKEKEI